MKANFAKDLQAMISNEIQQQKLENSKPIQVGVRDKLKSTVRSGL
jgi:hypothetical protein